jgi:hypothetical protein
MAIRMQRRSRSSVALGGAAGAANFSPKTLFDGLEIALLKAGFIFMTIDQAEKRIQTCFDDMRTRYGGRVVFDEWAIISLGDNKARVLVYSGPRKEGFRQNFAADASGLRCALVAGEHPVGDFEFSRHAVGTGFESFMVIGEGIYLICNNTVQTMDAIAKDPLWLNAQVPFVALGETFRTDPVA